MQGGLIGRVMKLVKTVLMVWMSLLFASSGVQGLFPYYVSHSHLSHQLEDADTNHEPYSHSHDDHADHSAQGIGLPKSEPCCSTHEHIPFSGTRIPEYTVSQASVMKILKLRVVSFLDIAHLKPARHFSASAYAFSRPFLGAAIRPDRTVVLRI